MHIVIFSINPLFPDRVMGGAPKQLQKVALHLGELDHRVTVLCTRSQNSHTPFRWHPNVLVQPHLRFKQPFPQPYATPAYNIANAFHDVGDALQTADRFYMHDGELLFPSIYQHIPTIFSLRDNVYPETMLGGFLFQGDALIAISEYSRQFYTHTIGRFFPAFTDRLHVVYNGIDWQQFKPTPIDQLPQHIDIQPHRYAYVLHPHRPEPSKGLPQTIAVVDRLVHHHGLDHVRVLAPLWLPDGRSPEVDEFYKQMQADIAARELRNHFIFHDWIPQSLMPEYYSLGAVMLSLGHFPESFGNTVYESLGCGTRAVAARVSTHRELLPDDLMDKVHFDDIETAANIAARIIINQEHTSQETLTYLHETYTVDKQVHGYAKIILDARRLGRLEYNHQRLSGNRPWRLAPWCYRWSGGIYHDFLARHRRLPTLTALLTKLDTFTIADAADYGVSAKEIDNWYRDGYLVPADLL